MGCLLNKLSRKYFLLNISCKSNEACDEFPPDHMVIIYISWNISTKEHWVLGFSQIHDSAKLRGDSMWLLYIHSGCAKQLTYVCLDWNAMWSLTSLKDIPGEEKSLQSRILELTTSSGLRWNWLHLNHIIYSHLDQCLLSCIVSTCWFERVFPSFCSFSLSVPPSVTAWLGLLDHQDGWRDLKIDRLKESQDQGTGAKMRFKGCRSALTEKKWETDNHSLSLFPPLHLISIFLPPVLNSSLQEPKHSCGGKSRLDLISYQLCWVHMEIVTYSKGRVIQPVSLTFFSFLTVKHSLFQSELFLTTAVISVN